MEYRLYRLAKEGEATVMFATKSDACARRYADLTYPGVPHVYLTRWDEGQFVAVPDGAAELDLPVVRY